MIESLFSKQCVGSVQSYGHRWLSYALQALVTISLFLVCEILILIDAFELIAKVMSSLIPFERGLFDVSLRRF